jgi:hypothetical protein
MQEERPNFASQLDFIQIEDFSKTGVFGKAVEGVDGVIHVASVSPLNGILLSSHLNVS